jgi:NADH:ubiquinone oxidoreductase subunit 2 (subunit N)
MKFDLKNILFSGTFLILGFLSVFEQISLFIILVLFCYTMAYSFIRYQSIDDFNIVHISWMSVCVSLCFLFDSFVPQVFFTMLVPFTLFLNILEFKKLKSFFYIRILETLLFISALILVTLNEIQIASVILVISILIRQVQVPFHFWAKDTVFLRKYYPSFLFFILVQSGFLLYAKSFIHTHNSVLTTFLIPALTLFTGLLMAIGALREKDLLVKHLLLLISQSCLPMAAFYTHNSTSATGGVLFALLLFVAGLICSLIAFHIYIQRGIIKLDRYYSLYRSNKNLSLIYLVSAGSIVGLPFTLGYISEDILFHGLVESFPLLAGVYILMTAINGFTVFRTYNHLFLGHTQYKSAPMYFTSFNKLCISLGMIFIFLGGFLSGFLAQNIETKILKLEQQITYNQNVKK